MEWVALVTWGLVMMVALPLGVGAVVRPEFALAAMVAGAGFVLTLLWVIIEGNKWPLWAATGCGVVALVLVGVGSMGLVTSDRSYGSDRLQLIAESVSGLAAAQLFLLLYVTLFTGAAALGATAS
jgi:hypothetical protein